MRRCLCLRKKGTHLNRKKSLRLLPRARAGAHVRWRLDTCDALNSIRQSSLWLGRHTGAHVPDREFNASVAAMASPRPEGTRRPSKPAPMLPMVRLARRSGQCGRVSLGSIMPATQLPLRIGEIFYASPGVLAAAGAVSPVARMLPRY
jgi:hypothetical protein